jgi:hypothetical protein
MVFSAVDVLGHHFFIDLINIYLYLKFSEYGNSSCTGDDTKERISIAVQAEKFLISTLSCRFFRADDSYCGIFAQGKNCDASRDSR